MVCPPALFQRLAADDGAAGLACGEALLTLVFSALAAGLTALDAAAPLAAVAGIVQFTKPGPTGMGKPASLARVAASGAPNLIMV